MEAQNKNKLVSSVEKKGKNNLPACCRWINLIHPSRKKLKEVSTQLQIPLDFLVDSLDIDERARVETDDFGNTLIVVRIPIFQGDQEEIPFTTLPLGLIILSDAVVTVCRKDNPILDEFIQASADINGSTKKNKYVLNLFNKIVISFLGQLKEINKRTNQVERELHGSLRNEELIKLLNIEKSLVYFTTSLSSNDIMFNKLLKGKVLSINEEEQDILEDIIIDNKQAIEMASIYSNILSGLMDAFASVISNNLNVVMKFLTSFTIILMFSNLVAGLYGMNVTLPLQESPNAFIFVLIVSFMLSMVSVVVFRKKGWL